MTSLALAIAVEGRVGRLTDCFAICEAPARDPSTEIHVACDPEHAPATAARRDSLFTRKLMRHCSTFGDSAIAQSRSDWVAILHADALPAPGWFAAIHRAIET